MSYIILDLDNCISDDRWRIPMIRWEREDLTLRYQLYHALCWADEPGNTDLFRNQKYGIIIMTARPDTVGDRTELWLEENGIRWETLLMRPKDEHGMSARVKQNQLLSLPTFGIPLHDIACAYDDRPDVVAMYRSNGIRAEVRAIHNVCAMTPPVEAAR